MQIAPIITDGARGGEDRDYKAVEDERRGEAAFVGGEFELDRCVVDAHPVRVWRRAKVAARGSGGVSVGIGWRRFREPECQLPGPESLVGGADLKVGGVDAVGHADIVHGCDRCCEDVIGELRGFGNGKFGAALAPAEIGCSGDGLVAVVDHAVDGEGSRVYECWPDVDILKSAAEGGEYDVQLRAGNCVAEGKVWEWNGGDTVYGLGR